MPIAITVVPAYLTVPIAIAVSIPIAMFPMSKRGSNVPDYQRSYLTSE